MKCLYFRFKLYYNLFFIFYFFWEYYISIKENWKLVSSNIITWNKFIRILTLCKLDTLRHKLICWIKFYPSTLHACVLSIDQDKFSVSISIYTTPHTNKNIKSLLICFLFDFLFLLYLSTLSLAFIIFFFKNKYFLLIVVYKYPIILIVGLDNGGIYGPRDYFS